ncbi:MAG: B12-binding domain-containing protein, partial [Pirellulaceae bacterium]
MKRWCDQGLIETTKTAGGHRRLLLASVLEFLRQQKFELVRPEVLGLPVTGGSGERSLQRARSRLLDALLDGDETSALRVLMDLHVAGHRVASICDEVVSAVFTEIGERWACGSADVFQERRACEICSRGLDALRRTLPAPSAGAPHALGCAPDRDPYTLATTAIEVVLTQAGWRATSLGSRIPFPSLERAIVRYQPRLVWLSLSYLDDEASFLDEYHRFYESLAGGPPLIVGGRAWT